MFTSFVSKVGSLVQSTGSNTFPYTIGEEIIYDNNIWKLFQGKKNDGTNEKVTIFSIDSRKSMTQNRIDAALHCINKIKLVRHPDILSYKDSLITDDKIYFVTEYVEPLTLYIKNKINQNESFILLGLYQISCALSFVHNDLNNIHCLVTPSSIFVNEAGDFKLGSFELCHEYKKPPSHFLANFDLLQIKYRPKELSSNSNDIIEILINNPIHSIDSWCIGCIIFEMFSIINNNDIFTKPQQLSSLKSIPYNLQSFYKRLLATKPSSRVTLKSLIKDCDFILQNSLVQTSIFISEIAIKSDNEKRQFLQHLDQNIESYPSSICKHKILPTLTHLLQHGFGSNPLILSCVLKISSLFFNDNNDEKLSKIRPVVINMFKNNERGTRINLLKSLPKFINYLDQDTISNDIWPQLINGFTDSSPVLREQSVRSVIHFTPKLSDNIITKQLLPLLDKIQSNDNEPAIRTNICIVLGKIAKFINIKNNKQNELLLVECFIRCLNDKFIPCRNAALLSFAATIPLFTPNIIANKILPYIIKYTCDPYKSIRDSSFKCIQIGLQKLKQHALTLSDKPPIDNNNNNNNQSTPKQSQQSQPDHTNNNTSYLGNVTSWAQRMTGYDNDNTNDNNTNDKNINDNTNDNANDNKQSKSGMQLKTNDDDPFQFNDDEDNDDNNNNNSNNNDKNDKKPVSLDDFFASFNEDLNKKEKKKDDENIPKSKIKYKNKSKKKKKKKSKKSVKKEVKEEENNDKNKDDDFFDDDFW